MFGLIKYSLDLLNIIFIMLKYSIPAIKARIEINVSYEIPKLSKKSCLDFHLTRSSLHLNHYNSTQEKSKIYERADDLTTSFKINKNFRLRTPKCSKILNQKLKYSKKIEAIKYRLRKIEEIKEKYDFNISPKSQLSNYQIQKLEKQAKQTFQHNQKKKAVDTIETWWKTIIINRKIKLVNEMLNKKASIIQKKWRFYKAKTNLKKALNKILNSIILIQKHFRGYLSRKLFHLNLKIKSMQETFSYFQNLKQQLQTESVLKIQKAWKQFKLKQKKLPKSRIQILKTSPLKRIQKLFEQGKSATTSSKIPSISSKPQSNSSSVHSKSPKLPQIHQSKARTSIKSPLIKY